jgi:hypothetical protein
MSASNSKVKANIHWLASFLAGVAALAATWFVYQQTDDLSETIHRKKPSKTPLIKLPDFDFSAFEKNAMTLKDPAKWGADHAGSLFVSERFLLEDGVLRNPETASFYSHSDGRSIDNAWFLSFPTLEKLLGTPKLHLQDSDEDGFTNEEEWSAKTDPTDAKSHPPLVSKLFFVKQTEVNNRIRLKQVVKNASGEELITIERVDAKLPTWLQTPKKYADKINAIKFLQPTLKKGQCIGDVTLLREDGKPETAYSIGDPHIKLLSIEHLTDVKVPLDRVRFIDTKSGRERIATKPTFSNDSRDPALVVEADFADKSISLTLRYAPNPMEYQTEPGKSVELTSKTGEKEVYKVKDSTANSVILIDSKEAEIQVYSDNQNSQAPPPTRSSNMDKP